MSELLTLEEAARYLRLRRERARLLLEREGLLHPVGPRRRVVRAELEAALIAGRLSNEPPRPAPALLPGLRRGGLLR